MLCVILFLCSSFLLQRSPHLSLSFTTKLSQRQTCFDFDTTKKAVKFGCVCGYVCSDLFVNLLTERRNSSSLRDLLNLGQ